MVVKNKILFQVLKGYFAVSFFPFIFTKLKKNEYVLSQIKKGASVKIAERKWAIIINHEKIHLAQQRELLIIPFYVLYGISFLRNYLKYKNRKEAYRNIIFEREALHNENSFEYLSKRTFWNFLNAK